jgi:hypothetical protein
MNIFTQLLNYYFSFYSYQSENNVPLKVIQNGFVNSILAEDGRPPIQTKKSLPRILDSNILKNQFVEEDIRNHIFNIYRLAMRRYLTLLRFKWKLQLLYCRKCNVDTDLHLNSLSDIPDNLKLTIMQNKTSYVFRLADLGRIIESALESGTELMPVPQWPMNPYTNIPFSRSTLIIIYQAYYNSKLRVPTLFGLFANINFDLRLFEMRYEGLIKERSINNLLRNGSSELQFEFIKEMIIAHKNDIKKINIHPSFPKNKIIDALKESLGFYVRSRYASSFFERADFKKKTRSSLHRFAYLNPYWGRIIVVQPEVSQVERELSQLTHSIYLVSEKQVPCLTNTSDGRFVDIVNTDEKNVIIKKKPKRREIYSIGN